MVRNCISPPPPWPIARRTVSFTAVLFSQPSARPPSFFPAVHLHASSKSRESQWSKLPEEDICGCDSALALKRNERSKRRGRERERFGEKRAANREGKPTATTDQYIVSDVNFNDRFFGSSPEFGTGYLFKNLCNLIRQVFKIVNQNTGTEDRFDLSEH